MFHRVGIVALALWFAVGGGASAQFLDPALSWSTLETPHFRVIFHPGTEGMARLTAQAAEEAYAYWKEKLGYAPAGKVEVVVVDFQDGPNGFASLVPNNEFVNFTAYAGFAGGFANSESPSWEELVTFHEYGHIADLDFVSGLSQTLRGVFGRIVLPGMGEPTLLIEGLPTYGEFLHRGASRANEPRVAMMLRAMVLEHAFPTYQQASFYYSRTQWPAPGSISHDMGPWFLRYLEEAYGPDTFARLKRAMAEDPWWAFGSLTNAILSVGLNGDFNAIFERVVGQPMDALWAEFQRWLADRFAEQIDRIQAEGLTASRQLTAQGYGTGTPRWSPDGQWVYYLHGSPQRAWSLRRVHPDGTGDEALVSGAIGDFALSPDGAFVVYAKLDVYQKFYLRYDLYRFDLDTGRETRLTWGERPFQVALTPDGEAVIYARYNWGEQPPSLRRLELASGEITTVREFPPDTVIEGLALAPDGQTVALSLWQRGGYQGIWTLDLDGGAPVPLVNDRATNFQPSWSPDGEYLLFSSDRTGVYNLYAYRLSDGALVRVSNVLTGAFAPQLSPDGVQLAFAGYSARGYDVHLMAFAPEAGTSVDVERETAPAWPGFPQTADEVRPYDPTPSLVPKLWFPILGESELGAGTFGQDALFAQFYSLSGGWDWAAGEPFFSLVYANSGMLPTLSLNVSRSAAGYAAGVEAGYPLALSFATSQRVSAGYQREDFGQLHQNYTARWTLSSERNLDAFSDRFSVSVLAELIQVEGQAPLRKVTTAWREALRLPVLGGHWLSLRFAGGWSDAEQPERGFALGGPEGTFKLRGFQPGVQRGKLAASGSLEYRFPLFPIERGISLWPVFFDDLSGTAFVEAGAAGEVLDLNALKLSFGAELALKVNVSYFGGPTFRWGLAQGLGEAGPRVYFGVGL